VFKKKTAKQRGVVKEIGVGRGKEKWETSKEGTGFRRALPGKGSKRSSPGLRPTMCGIWKLCAARRRGKRGKGTLFLISKWGRK